MKMGDLESVQNVRNWFLLLKGVSIMNPLSLWKLRSVYNI